MLYEVITLGFVSTTTLKPEPIPLDIKVVLVGERWLYYILCAYDKEFGSLFRIAADFVITSYRIQYTKVYEESPARPARR